jgi:putative oxidoreductase
MAGNSTFFPIKLYNDVAQFAQNVLSEDLLTLLTRLGVAGIFFMSGRTKVDGILHITDGTYTLFREDYKLPLVPPDLAAHLATYSEHLFSILLVLGLLTRLSATVFFIMTATIEIFVYPDAWPTHLSWAALLIFLMARGGGRWSLDRALTIR